MSDVPFPFVGLESFARNLYNDDAKLHDRVIVWTDLTGDERRYFRKMAWMLCVEGHEQNKVSIFDGKSDVKVRP